MNRFNINKLKNIFILNSGLIYLFVFLFIASFMALSIYFTYNDSHQNERNPEDVYQTWKVLKFYKNGKLVVNDKKFADLRFRVNRDSTAEWIGPGTRLKIAFQISEDGSQIITDKGVTIEDIETVFELNENKFRFGKRNVLAHYEYVMIPDNAVE